MKRRATGALTLCTLSLGILFTSSPARAAVPDVPPLGQAALPMSDDGGGMLRGVEAPELLGGHEPAGGSNDPETLSIWGTLVDISKVLKRDVIIKNYPKYAGIADSFVMTAGERRWKRFMRYHRAGQRKKARAVLRRFAGF